MVASLLVVVPGAVSSWLVNAMTTVFLSVSRASAASATSSYTNSSDNRRGQFSGSWLVYRLSPSLCELTLEAIT